MKLTIHRPFASAFQFNQPTLMFGGLLTTADTVQFGARNTGGGVDNKRGDGKKSKGPPKREQQKTKKSTDFPQTPQEKPDPLKEWQDAPVPKPLNLPDPRDGDPFFAQ